MTHTKGHERVDVESETDTMDETRKTEKKEEMEDTDRDEGREAMSSSPENKTGDAP
ncbi:hypothetical protein HY969_04540 [Candidatus Kaiserbacteria bacterium]|nr:hypothetical protein [Candidatus Kaiserbacteria bacterium]